MKEMFLIIDKDSMNVEFVIICHDSASPGTFFPLLEVPYDESEYRVDGYDNRIGVLEEIVCLELDVVIASWCYRLRMKAFFHGALGVLLAGILGSEV